MIDLLYLLLLLKVQIVLINLSITWVLDKQRWTKQITKKYFNKRFIMSNEDEEIYNNSHICWICKQELNTDKKRDIVMLLVNLEVQHIINVI